MFNLMKMDIYRMFHSVSTWVILAVTAGLAVFFILMTNSDLDAMADDAGYAQEMEAESQADDELQMGIYSDTDPAWISGDIEAGELIGTGMRSGLLTLLCVIFSALFANADQKNGYIKNIAGQLPHRGVLALSNAVAAAIQIFLMMAVFSAGIVLSGMILWGNRICVGPVKDLFLFLAVQYLLNLGFSALIQLLSIVTRSSAFAMTAGILAVMGLLVPVYSLINRAVGQFRPKWNFDITRYVMEGNIPAVGMGAPSEVLIRGCAVGCVFLLISTAIAMLILNKRDVR